MFLHEAKRYTAGWLIFPAIDAGMDATGWLKPSTDDAHISKQLAAIGLDAPPVSAYSLSPRPAGLVFGFTAFSPAQIRSGMKAIVTASKL